MEIVFFGYTLVTALILGSVFYWDLFPACFVEGVGLTTFKKISEYIISLILIVTIVILLKKSSWFDSKVLRLLLVSIFLTVISELAFAVYLDVYGIFNLLGHYFKIISFYLIYKGLVKTGLTKPYTVLFRNLKKKEESLQSAHAELEQRVHERTAELFRANEQLRKEIEERIHAQEDLREAEHRYRTVADFTYDWEYWSNHEGAMQYVSPSCERITGYKAREFIECPDLIRSIIEPEDRSLWDQYLHDFPEKLEPRKIQFRICRRDGRIRWIEQFCQPVVDANGEFRGLRASNRDFTKRKQVEDSLHQSKENFRMLADRLLEAQESERRRLAREMHDDMTQRLAVLAIDAGKLEQELQSTPGPTLDKLRQMREGLIKLTDDVHAISRRLHPSIIDDLGLVDAIESECTNFHRRYGIPVIWRAEEIRPDIPKNIALSIYRVVQESLRNVAKHAGATEITVSLSCNENYINLFIQDNGIGFDLKKEKRTSGLGLASMKERVYLVQGDFSIRTQKGQGTILEVQVPTAKYYGRATALKNPESEIT